MFYEQYKVCIVAFWYVNCICNHTNITNTKYFIGIKKNLGIIVSIGRRWGTWWCSWLKHCVESRGFDSRWCHWNFSFRLYYGPGVDSASNRNEYQEYFLGWRRPVRRADKLTTFMCQFILKTGSLNLLEPSGPVLACNGIAFALATVPGVLTCFIVRKFHSDEDKAENSLSC